MKLGDLTEPIICLVALLLWICVVVFVGNLLLSPLIAKYEPGSAHFTLGAIGAIYLTFYIAFKVVGGPVKRIFED